MIDPTSNPSRESSPRSRKRSERYASRRAYAARREQWRVRQQWTGKETEGYVRGLRV